MSRDVRDEVARLFVTHREEPGRAARLLFRVARDIAIDQLRTRTNRLTVAPLHRRTAFTPTLRPKADDAAGSRA